ncbi:MAG: L-threonylcarbamoyladenylate synthase [Tissierellia bacterium]|nr:L-threonylcarbamoyladenylate synthase [Tissierellia bacterium]
METEILHISSTMDTDKIKKAANALQEGKLVVFPTETVYGLGADGRYQETVDKIFKAKGRPGDNPLILHVGREEQVEELVLEIPQAAKDCMIMFWPGPLTIIFNKNPDVPENVTAGLDTVAIRMPSHPIAEAILKEANIPVAAPSANVSGRPSPTKVDHVKEDLMGKVDMIVDGGITDVGIESTVLDVTVDPPMVLRPGSVTVEELKVLLGDVRMDEGLIQAHSKKLPKSPGQKYKHYAPKAECVLFGGNLSNVAKEVNRRIKENPHKKIGVMATTETIEMYQGADLLLNMGSRTDLREVAHNIFDQLRYCDEEGMDYIYIEGFELTGMGAGIMNRLLKACGGKVVLGL